MQQPQARLPTCRPVTSMSVSCRKHRQPVRQPWRQFSRHEQRCYRQRSCCCQAANDPSHFTGFERPVQPDHTSTDTHQESISEFADMLRGSGTGNSSNGSSSSSSNNGSRPDIDSRAVIPGLERAFLVGVARKGHKQKYTYTITESLEELGRLAETAGLEVVGQTFQQLENPSPRTYMGSGKALEVETAVGELDVDTVIFDDELTPGQLRNLEKAWGDEVRLCDRTALILDIFSQRAATREGQLQVELAQSEYQLPRLTKMWTHLERQAGGKVRGMGEKQIEVDKRLLRTRMGQLRRSLDDVRMHRKQYRERRAQAPVPVVALVGYTNAGKSTLLNRLTDAAVVAEDKLFATLDPTTRRVSLPSSKQNRPPRAASNNSSSDTQLQPSAINPVLVSEVLLTDTVGFIQKLPTQLVAAFRATLEEITEASLLLHVVDVSHPNAAAQTQAVMQVLEELDVGHIPMVSVWNKVDVCTDPVMVQTVADKREGTVCISAQTGQGLPELLRLIEGKIQESMLAVDVVVPYAQGELVGEIHRIGIIESEEFLPAGSHVVARVPVPLAMRLAPFEVTSPQPRIAA